MKRLALIAIGAVALLLSACAPTFDLTSQVPVQILSITTPAAKGGTVVVQGRNFGDGRTGGADANYVLFARTSDTTHGQRLTVNEWTPRRIAFTSPEEAGNGWITVVANDVASQAFPVSLP
ncbi:MAG: IPT/TIG domain-containing protein [Trueperaceae bacterium]